jgi:hypothetical protein
VPQPDLMGLKSKKATLLNYLDVHKINNYENTGKQKTTIQSGKDYKKASLKLKKQSLRNIH